MTKDELQALQDVNELALTATETTWMLDIFAQMQACENQLQLIDTEKVEVMVHVLPLTNVFREDIRRQPFSRTELLAGAPEHTEDSWQVPRLVK